jgi:hypothetical protein
VIIGPASCLRRIPVALDRKQGYFLEGIRVSIEMIDLAHARLQNSLLAVTGAFRPEGGLQQDLLTAAMADAWLIVDAFHRLADLAQHMPNVVRRNQIPFFHNLIAANGAVNELRNTVQHLPEQIHGSTVDPNWSVWGVLSWCVPPAAEVGGEILSCSYFCGKLNERQSPLLNPVGAISRPVGLMTLSQEPTSVSLSDLYTQVERFAAGLERMTDLAFRSDPRFGETYGSDVLICLSLTEADEPATGQQRQ